MRPHVVRGASHAASLQLSGQRAVPVCRKHLQTRRKWALERFRQRLQDAVWEALTEEQVYGVMVAVMPDMKRWVEAAEAVAPATRTVLTADEYAAALNPFTGESDPRFCLLCGRLCDWRARDWYWSGDPQYATHFRCVRT